MAHKSGRPSKFTKALADRICDEIISGRSLRTICLDSKMPAPSMVFRWLADDRYKTFREQYAHACQARTDALVEEIFDIADDGHNDWMEKNFGNRTETVVNREAIERSKLRVDSRKWYASKMKPKKYGEKLDLTSDGEKVQVAPLVVSDIKPRKSDETTKTE